MTVLMLMMMVIMIIAPVPTHPFVFRYYFGIKESLKGSGLKKAELQFCLKGCDNICVLADVLNRGNAKCSE